MYLNPEDRAYQKEIREELEGEYRDQIDHLEAVLKESRRKTNILGTSLRNAREARDRWRYLFKEVKRQRDGLREDLRRVNRRMSRRRSNSGIQQQGADD